MNRLNQFIGIAAFILLSAAGCSSSSDTPDMGGKLSYEGTLSVELRNHVDVKITETGAQAMDVSLKFSDGDFKLFDQSKPLTASGRIENFPEAAMQLFTAHFSSPPIAGGPCGDKPISLALALSNREGNKRVGGGLTAYCGADTWFGTPARVVRITGNLQPMISLH